MRLFSAYEMALISCSVLSATCSMARADLITFGREHVAGNSLIDEQNSGSITRMGLTASFTANVGELNANSTAFGINAPGSGDEPARLDTFNGVEEFITVTFDRTVAFTQLKLRDFSPGESALLKIGLNETLTLVPFDAATDIYDFTNESFLLGNSIAPGQSLVIGSATGNGFSLESFDVNTVPEPSCLGAALPALAGLLFRRKRKPSVLSR